MFQADWANAATSQTKSAGISALGIKTNGKFADNKVTIDLNLSGPSGLSLNGGGSVEVAGSKALALKFDGIVPFDVLAGQLSAQGYAASGAAKVNVQIGGTTAAPAITGSVNISGAKLLDIRRNLAVNAISANLTLEGQQARLVSLNATLGSGGTVSPAAPSVSPVTSRQTSPSSLTGPPMSTALSLPPPWTARSASRDRS